MSATTNTVSAPISYVAQPTTTEYDPSLPAAVIDDFAPYDPASLIIYANLLLLSLCAFWALCKLPQIIARLKVPAEWLAGHMLYHVATKRPKTRVLRMHSQRRGNGKPAGSSSNHNHNGGRSHHGHRDANATDDSHTLVSHGAPYTAQRVDGKGVPIEPVYPPHFPTYPGLLRFTTRWLTMRLVPGYSLASAIVMLIWLCVLMYPSFYGSSPFTDPERTGWVALAQLPFVFGFAAKNGIISLLLGYGYEKLNRMHRFVGRVVVVAANVHALGYFYKWSLQGRFMIMLKRPITTWGMIGLLCLDILFFFSTSWLRARAYNVFLASHILSFLFLLPAIYIHMPSTLPYLLACVGIFALDYAVRLIVKTRIVRAHIRPMPALSSTRIEIPALNSGWRPGQHVRVRVLSTDVTGLFGWMEIHPFTIASVGYGSEEGMVLIAKKAGTWTKRLYDHACIMDPLAPVPEMRQRQRSRNMSTPGAPAIVEKDFAYSGGNGKAVENLTPAPAPIPISLEGKQVRLMIEGPYGGPGHTVFSSFSSAVFVVGGSGITFALGVLQDLIQKDLSGRSRIKVLEIVWVVPDPSAVVPLVPLLTTMIDQSIFTPLHISIYYTRALPHSTFAPTLPSPMHESNSYHSSKSNHAGSSTLPGSSSHGKGSMPSPPKMHRTNSPTKGGSHQSQQSQSQHSHHSAPAHSHHSLNAPLNPLTFHAHPNLSIQPGRPRLADVLASTISATVSLSGPTEQRKKDERNTGMVVGVCGPVELGDEVVRVVEWELDAKRKRQVGGVEVVEEIFAW